MPQQEKFQYGISGDKLKRLVKSLLWTGWRRMRVRGFKGIKLKVDRKEVSVFHQHIECASPKYSTIQNSFVCALLHLSQTPEFSASVIFSLHVMKNIFFYQPDTQVWWCVCTNVKARPKMFPWSCLNKAHYAWNIPKETGRTFTGWITVVSWIQRIISTQATERDSGVRIFQDGYFLLCWVSTSFHHFSAAVTIGKRRRKKRKQLSGDICPYVVLIFVFTLLYSIVKNNGKA